nr:hypothetical protein B0A51_10668 [Rachicladosporium sp. CCFEE 5018]
MATITHNVTITHQTVITHYTTIAHSAPSPHSLALTSGPSAFPTQNVGDNTKDVTVAKVYWTDETNTIKDCTPFLPVVASLERVVKEIDSRHPHLPWDRMLLISCGDLATHVDMH